MPLASSVPIFNKKSELTRAVLCLKIWVGYFMKQNWMQRLQSSLYPMRHHTESDPERIYEGSVHVNLVFEKSNGNAFICINLYIPVSSYYGRVFLF